MNGFRWRTCAVSIGAAIATSGLIGLDAARAAELPNVPGTPDLMKARATSSTSCEMNRRGEYPEAAPENAGLDPAKLRRALGYASAHGSETIKVFRHGCLLGQGRQDAVFDRVPRQNWSQTKTVVALITGIARDKSYVDLDAPIGEYLPEDLGDDEHRAVTLRHLLHMSAGHQMSWARGLNLVADNSRAREFFAMPMAHRPGTYFEYDQIGPSVITYVLQRAIARHERGLDFQAFAQRELFDQLGIPTSAYWWQRDRSGNTSGYSQLFLRPLEFGRLGELLRNEGIYQDRRVVSADYLDELRAPAPTNCGYGFLIWRNGCKAGQRQVNGSILKRRELAGVPLIASAPADLYMTWGYHGQHVFVIPSLDMVITRSGEAQLDALPGAAAGDPDAAIAGTQKEGYHEFFRLLMASVTDMPDSVRDSIANPGPYTGGPELNLDPGPFLNPVDAVPGSFLGIGPGAPAGCTALGCQGEANDGLVRWISDVPGTVPGVIGMEQRPDG